MCFTVWSWQSCLRQTAGSLRNLIMFARDAMQPTAQHIGRKQSSMSASTTPLPVHKQQNCFDNWQHAKEKARTLPPPPAHAFTPKTRDHFLLQRHPHLPGPGAHPDGTAGSHCKQTGYSLCAHVAHKLKAWKQENFLKLDNPIFCSSSLPLSLHPSNTPPLPFGTILSVLHALLWLAKIGNKRSLPALSCVLLHFLCVTLIQQIQGKAELILLTSTCHICSNTGS